MTESSVDIIETKQPIKLYYLSFVDVWERYGFYAARNVLVLYMISVLGLTKSNSYMISSAFSAILYLTPILGGLLADKYLTPTLTIVFGGVVLSLGYSALALPGMHYFYMGLALVTVGSGMFMPNIAGQVAGLYHKNDIRKEGGFSIFYTAINIGSLFPPLINNWIVRHFGWSGTFYMGSLALVVAVICFMVIVRHKLIKMPPEFIGRVLLSLLAVIVAVGVIAKLIQYYTYANIALFSVGGFFILYTLYRSFQYEKAQRNRLLACIFLVGLSIIFSILYQQASMSFNLFTDFNTNRNAGGWHIPTLMFQAVNPFFIILLGPVMAKSWVWLGRIKCNPSVPVKFGLGTCFMGIGFAIMPFIIHHFSLHGKVSYVWIIVSYFFQTLGEMFVSPIGLSMVADLSPVKMMGLMMGVWYFATAAANDLAGFVSVWTTATSDTNDPLLTSTLYAHVFGELGIVSIIAGFVIFLTAPKLKKLIAS
jgi:proton-dependent oligopeptide transporter, POT family